MTVYRDDLGVKTPTYNTRLCTVFFAHHEHGASAHVCAVDVILGSI
jgi:hypothetical protein